MKLQKKWLEEIEGEENLDDFKERNLASSYICNEDFKSGDMLLLVNNATTPFSDWFISDSISNEDI